MAKGFNIRKTYTKKLGLKAHEILRVEIDVPKLSVPVVRKWQKEALKHSAQPQSTKQER